MVQAHETNEQSGEVCARILPLLSPVFCQKAQLAQVVRLCSICSYEAGRVFESITDGAVQSCPTCSTQRQAKFEPDIDLQLYHISRRTVSSLTRSEAACRQVTKAALSLRLSRMSSWLCILT